MELPNVKPSNAWAWIGLLLSVSLNVLAAVWINDALKAPDYPLCPPPAVEKSK
jgi:hypothetical protein